MLSKTEQKTFEQMFWDVVDADVKPKEKLDMLADVLFELTGNVNLRMWLFRLKVK